MILYIVRHGQTDNNINGIIQGIIESDLNETGKKQAEEVYEKLKGVDIDLVISSPLQRALETAEIITKGRDIPLVIDKRIIERNAGDFEGKKDIGYDHKLVWDYKLNTDLNANVEKVQDIFKRVKSFLEDIKTKYKDKTVLIVTHEATLRALNYSILGFNEDDDLSKLEIKNCTLFQYKI